MGLGTIFDARKILLLALGEHKAEIIREVAEGPVSPRVPASYLQEHADATVLVDAAAGSQLTAEPARRGSSATSNGPTPLIKRAILWLCEQTGKALLKLTDDDFRNHNLHQLLRHHGPAQKVAHRVFQQLMDTIEYHPAGKEPRRVICFSPHPDDDVISMGGTLIRLVEDGHEVHIAYMTSGNIAVFDHDAARVADLVTEYNRLFGIDQERSKLVEGTVLESLARKARRRQSDIDAVQKIKGLIRWSEAKAGAFKVGCREEHLHFLDLPFYRTGTIAKKPIGGRRRADHPRAARARSSRTRSMWPATCPIRTARTACVPRRSFGRLLEHRSRAAAAGPKCCSIAGPGRNMTCTRSKSPCRSRRATSCKKRKAIFMHQSQKDEALFPGSDPREFWQRAEDRNTNTAAHTTRSACPSISRWKRLCGGTGSRFRARLRRGFHLAPHAARSMVGLGSALTRTCSDCAMNLVLDDTIRIPLGATKSLMAFRRWTKSGAYPDRGDYAYLGGELWADMSMETFLHNQLKGIIATVLSSLVISNRLGRFCHDRMRLVNESAALSCEPDAMFASREALANRRVRLEEGGQSLEVIGTPDMVLEVVSEHSVQKDTVALRELYAAAGIAEYWLVNSLGNEPVLDVLRLTAKGYVSTRKVSGWVKSGVFGKAFRLEAQDSEDDLPDYRLLVK